MGDMGRHKKPAAPKAQSTPQEQKKKIVVQKPPCEALKDVKGKAFQIDQKVKITALGHRPGEFGPVVGDVGPVVDVTNIMVTIITAGNPFVYDATMVHDYGLTIVKETRKCTEPFCSH